MGRRLLTLSVILASCRYTPPSVGGGGEDADVLDDARPDAPPGVTCYGTGLVDVCFDTPLTGTLDVTGPIDTDEEAECTVVEPQVDGPELCVIGAGQISVTTTVVATGSRPLVLIAAEMLSLSATGTVDVSSTRAGRCGAGCNFSGCSIAGAGTPDGGGGGGGAGGSFGTIGGIGGLGDLNNNQPPAGMAPGGNPGAVATPTVLRGGCPGADGGGGNGITGGTGGRGAGAVYLIAGDSISIEGNVYASGAGGTISSGGAGFQDGGGAGGSGGMIGLDAPAISITGRVVANGAAGSGGGGDSGGGPGGDGTTELWNVAAIGGTAGPTVAGPGGAGTAIGALAGVDAIAADAGGGGGGGGLGVVWIDGIVTGGAMMSPAPTPH